MKKTINEEICERWTKDEYCWELGKGIQIEEDIKRHPTMEQKNTKYKSFIYYNYT